MRAPMYFPATPWTRVSASAALIQTLATVALEAYVFGQFQRGVEPAIRQVADGHFIPMYMSLFLFGLAYQLVLVYSALSSNSMIQTVGICVYNACLLAYSISQPIRFNLSIYYLDRSHSPDGQPLLKPGNTVWEDSRPALIAIPFLLAAGTCVFCLAAWNLRSEFAWLLYKTIHGDVALKRRMLILEIYMALLRFGFFFVPGFLLQQIIWTAGPGNVNPEFLLSIGLLVVAVVLFISAAVCVQMEHRAGTIAVIIGFSAAVGYFSYQVFELAGQPLHLVIAFAIIALVATGFTAVAGVLCLMNFGQGVRDLIGSRRNQATQESDRTNELYDHGSRRMFLD